MRLAIGLALALVVTLPAAAAQAPPTGAYGRHIGVGDECGVLAMWFSREPMDAAVVLQDANGTEVGSFTGTSTPLPQGAGFVHEVPLETCGPAALTWVVAGEDAPLFVPPASGPARLAFLGDQGVTPEAAAITAAIAAAGPDAVFHAGDVSYGEGDPSIWDAWFAQVAPVARSVPWLPALGNHETYMVPGPVPLDGAVFGLTGLPRPEANTEVDAFLARFGMPNNELWWRWRVGDVDVIALDTFRFGFIPEGEQVKWLVETLAGERAPWTIVYLHEPPYSSNAAHGSSTDLRAALAPILEAAGVDLLVSAHDHSYERTFPVVAEKVASRNYTKGAGPVYVVSGGGGEDLYDQFEDPAPEWSAFRAAEFHFVLVNATADALEVTALRADGTTLDRFVIESPAPPPAGAPAPPTAPTPAVAFAAFALAVGLAAVFRRSRTR